MRKLLYFSLAVATAVGGVFTVTSKAQNAEEVSANFRTMSSDMSGCSAAATDCAPTVIIDSNQR